MSIWMIVTFVALASAIAWWWLRYGEDVVWSELSRSIGDFSTYAARGGILTIRHARSRRTIQFAMIGDKSPTSRTLELVLPDMEWTGPFFDEFLSKAEAAGFACTVEMAPTEDSPVRRFASVTYSGTKDELVDRSVRLLQILAVFIDARPEDQANIRFRGVIRTSAIQEAKAKAAVN